MRAPKYSRADEAARSHGELRDEREQQDAPGVVRVPSSSARRRAPAGSRTSRRRRRPRAARDARAGEQIRQLAEHAAERDQQRDGGGGREEQHRHEHDLRRPDEAGAELEAHAPHERVGDDEQRCGRRRLRRRRSGHHRRDDEGEPGRGQLHRALLAVRRRVTAGFRRSRSDPASSAASLTVRLLFRAAPCCAVSAFARDRCVSTAET